MTLTDGEVDRPGGPGYERYGGWLVALAVVGAAVTAATARGDAGPFLVVAPIVPLALVAAAFAPGANPAGEASAAPLTGVGLALRRAVAVLVAGLGVLAVGALALPGLEPSAWVLPALALSLGALALAIWIRVEVAAGGLGALWLAALWAARLYTPAAVEDLTPLAAPGQIVCAALTVLAVAALVARRDAFATLGRTA